MLDAPEYHEVYFQDQYDGFQEMWKRLQRGKSFFYSEYNPSVRVEFALNPFYTVFSDHHLEYFFAPEKALSFFKMRKESFDRQRLETEYEQDVVKQAYLQQEFEEFEAYGVQEHVGSLPEYMVAAHDATPVRFLDAHEAVTAIRKCLKDISVYDFLATAFCGVQHEDESVIHSPDVQRVVQYYRAEIPKVSIVNILPFLCKRAGLPEMEMDKVFVHPERAGRDMLQKYLKQYATRVVSQALQDIGFEHDVSSTTPNGWYEAMLDYEQLTQEIYEHGERLSVLHASHMIDFAPDAEGFLQPRSLHR